MQNPDAANTVAAANADAGRCFTAGTDSPCGQSTPRLKEFPGAGRTKLTLQHLAHETFKGYLRHFPVQMGKERLLNALWRPLSFGAHHRSACLKRAPLGLDCDLSQWIQRHLYFFGEYEAESCRLWSRLASSARVIFDVGANVGIYSLTAGAANPRAVVHAFEITPEIADVLRHNIQRNNLANVFVHEQGIGADDGVGYLRRCAGSSGANEGMNFLSNKPSTAKLSKVCLDTFCRDRQIDSIDLLKLDIEGGEFDALCGAGNLLAEKRIGCIFMELCESTARRYGHSAAELTSVLRQAGYHLFIPTRHGLRCAGNDNFEAENVLAFAHPPTPSLEGYCASAAHRRLAPK